jgi:hypothetical protein
VARPIGRREGGCRALAHIYAGHLNERVDEMDDARISVWCAKRGDLFTDLLVAMANTLGYSFDPEQVRRGIYYPKAHDEQERRRIIFEDAVCKVLTGETPLAMQVTEAPVTCRPSPPKIVP